MPLVQLYDDVLLADGLETSRKRYPARGHFRAITFGTSFVVFNSISADLTSEEEIDP